MASQAKIVHSPVGQGTCVNKSLRRLQGKFRRHRLQMSKRVWFGKNTNLSPVQDKALSKPQADRGISIEINRLTGNENQGPLERLMLVMLLRRGGPQTNLAGLCGLRLRRSKVGRRRKGVREEGLQGKHAVVHEVFLCCPNNHRCPAGIHQMA